jgi:hypothetical protein
MNEMIDYDNATIAITQQGTIVIRAPYHDEPCILKTALRLLEERGRTSKESGIQDIEVCIVLTATAEEVWYSVHMTDGTQTRVYHPYRASRGTMHDNYNLLADVCKQII